MPPPPPEPKSALPRLLEWTLLFTGLCWLGAATLTADHAALGLATRFNLVRAEPLLAAICTLFLLLCGFSALNWVGRRNAGLRAANALPARSTTREEWAQGAAIGWGALLATLLLPMLVGALHIQFWWWTGAWTESFLALLTAFVATLAIEVGFRGYLLQRATGALGTVGGTFLMAVLYALVTGMRLNATGLSTLIAFVAALLFSLAYLRTHALWLGWGLHFGWTAATAVLFGLPVSGMVAFHGVIDTETRGRGWLTGGAYGPEGALVALFVLSLAMVVLYRVTRDYAWNYTHPVIVAAGYPMDVPPPAAHSAMETAAVAKPAPLVQILPTTPAGTSILPVVEAQGTGSGVRTGSDS